MSDPSSKQPRDQPTPTDNVPVSKSARKREMTALQELGESLLDLPTERLTQLPLSKRLREGLELAKKLKQREARRRQLQYIGKLMRAENHQEISALMARFEDDNRVFRQRFQRLEKIRDDLIADDNISDNIVGDNVLEELLRSHPELDRQHLRQLIRQTRKALASENDADSGEAHHDKNGQKQPSKTNTKASAKRRKLFEYLRETLILD
jgi:ribosome-associated protein